MMGLDRFHLVVHDAGGPIGFEMAATMRARIRSLTLLNTVVDLGSVPFPMEFYAHFAIRNRAGRTYLYLMRNLGSTRKRGANYAPVIWAADDQTLPLRKHGCKAREAAGLNTIQTLPGKHFSRKIWRRKSRLQWPNLRPLRTITPRPDAR